jgi:hypothetical protein
MLSTVVFYTLLSSFSNYKALSYEMTHSFTLIQVWPWIPSTFQTVFCFLLFRLIYSKISSYMHT